MTRPTTHHPATPRVSRRGVAGFGCAVAWLVVLTGVVLVVTVALLMSTDSCLADAPSLACSPRGAAIVLWAPLGGLIAASALLVVGFFFARRHGESLAPWAVAGYSLVVLGVVAAYATTRATAVPV